MIRAVDPQFQVRIDEWNASHGGPSVIAVAWNPKKDRWQIFAIPVENSPHPLARNDFTSKMSRPLPDDSGRSGIILNTWEGAQGEFLPLDERLFEALNWADSFRSKQHFDDTIKNPELQAEMAVSKKARDMAYAGRSYWAKLSEITISMNPNVRVGGDWRSAKGLR